MQLKIIKKFLSESDSRKGGIIPIMEEPHQMPSVGQYDVTITEIPKGESANM